VGESGGEQATKRRAGAEIQTAKPQVRVKAEGEALAFVG
jgi:hypothetical protein